MLKLRKAKKKKMSKKTNYFYEARKNIWNGFFWAIGVTLGFAFVSVIAILILSPFKKIPVIGQFVADVVYETQVNLGKRTPRGLPVQN